MSRGSASAPATASSTSPRAASTRSCRRGGTRGTARPRTPWRRLRPATRSRSTTSSRCCPSRSPTTSTSTPRSSTRRTSAACSAPTPSRCCRTGATCRSAITAARARSSSAGRRCAGRRASPSHPTADAPSFGPSRRLDIELELGFVVGLPSTLGEPVPTSSVPRARLRGRARQRLERPRHPGLGVRPARPVPRQELRDLGLRLGDAARAPRGPAGAGARAGSRATAAPARGGRLGIRHPARGGAERNRCLARKRPRPLLDDAAAARARDVERRERPDRRPDGLGDDLRQRARQRGEPDRAELERAGAGDSSGTEASGPSSRTATRSSSAAIRWARSAAASSQARLAAMPETHAGRLFDHVHLRVSDLGRAAASTRLRSTRSVSRSAAATAGSRPTSSS